MHRFISSFMTVTLPFSMMMMTTDKYSNNAAKWYLRAIEAYESLPSDLVDSIQYWNWDDPNFQISDEMRLTLARIQPVLRLVRRGANQSYSDFDLAYEKGFDLSLPHLRAMRSITLLAIADTRALLRDGDSASAATGIAMMYRMGRHLGSEQILASSRLGHAVFDISDFVARTGFDSAAFGQDDYATMMSSLDQFSDSDPFNYIEALTMEREIMINWVEEKFSTENGPLQLTDLRQLARSNESEEEIQLSTMTESEFNDSLEQADQVMNSVIEAFMNPDKEAGRAALVDIGKEIEEGKYGMLAKAIIPTYDGIFDHMLRAEELLASRKASLSSLIKGELTPEQGRNAVSIYLRAITMLKEIDADKRSLWPSFVLDIDELVSKEDIKTLTNASPIIDVVREASQQDNCDFAATRHGSNATIPAYLPGFRELGNLLIGDAVRLFEEGEVDTAVDRLNIYLRLSAHLSRDNTIASALVSHDIFESASSMLRGELTQAFLKEEHRVVLEDALKAMSRKDPFGYIAAITGTRKELQNWFNNKTLKADKDIESLHDSLREWEADRLLAVQVMLTHRGDWEITWPESPINTLEPLTKVLSIEAIGRIIERTKEKQGAIATGDYSLFTENELPMISEVCDRFASARSDLRRCVRAVNGHLVTRSDAYEK